MFVGYVSVCWIYVFLLDICLFVGYMSLCWIIVCLLDTPTFLCSLYVYVCLLLIREQHGQSTFAVNCSMFV